MDRSLVIGLTTFAVTASILAIPALAQGPDARHSGEPVTRAQIEARIAERFAAADSNGDGSISRAEADARAQARRGERAERRFERMDVDDNGEISVAERDAMPRRHHRRRAVRRGQMIAENRNMRARLTPTESAPLTGDRAERRQARQARRVARVERHHQAWADADTNGNGTLDRAEFDALTAARHAHRRERAENGEGRRHARRHGNRFERSDANSDGMLTLAEVSARPLAMFDRADTNDDGTVTREERRAARAAGHRRHRRGG